MKTKSYHPQHLRCRRVLMIDYAPLPKWFLILFSPALTVIQTEHSDMKPVIATLQEPIDFVLFARKKLGEIKEELKWIKQTYPALPLIATSETEIQVIHSL